MRAFYHRFMRGMNLSVPRGIGSLAPVQSYCSKFAPELQHKYTKNHQKLTTPTCTKKQDKVPYWYYGTILTYFFAFVNRVIVNITEKFL